MTKKIDPRIYLPPVEGYEYTSVDDSKTVPAEDSGSVSQINYSLGLRPPQTVAVVEQIFRKDASGRVAVDLVLEVEDVPGATEYEIRVALA